jgi:hypothetical protein
LTLRSGSAALLGARNVMAIDVDAIALENARANARLNAVEKSIRFSSVPLKSIHRHFDFITANILSHTLIELAPHLKRILAPNRQHARASSCVEHRAGLMSPQPIFDRPQRARSRRMMPGAERRDVRRNRTSGRRGSADPLPRDVEEHTARRPRNFIRD